MGCFLGIRNSDVPTCWWSWFFVDRAVTGKKRAKRLVWMEFVFFVSSSSEVDNYIYIYPENLIWFFIIWVSPVQENRTLVVSTFRTLGSSRWELAQFLAEGSWWSSPGWSYHATAADGHLVFDPSWSLCECKYSAEEQFKRCIIIYIYIYISIFGYIHG